MVLIALFEKAQEMAFVSSVGHSVLKKILRMSTQPLIASWASGDASFLSSFGNCLWLCWQLKSVCDVDPERFNQRRISSADIALKSLIQI